MNVLALDLGTHTGWAVRSSWPHLCGHSVIESGVQDFSKKRGESNGMLFYHFNRWLRDMQCGELSCTGFNLVVWEQAHHRGGAATSMALGLSTRVEEFCAINGIEHASVHSATLKKFATDDGRASKELMIAHYHAIYGDPARKVTDDNECDALWLLQYAIKEILGEKAWNAQPVKAGDTESSTSEPPAR